jgi:two-component system chemotaxis response regulator CheY
MRIVVVDDSPTVRLSLKKCIEPLGHEVFVAEDGLDGLEKVRSHLPVDLVITDINMPRMDGLSFSKELKASPDTKAIPILVITTEGSGKMKEEAKEIGVSGWIVKPFQPDLIRKSIDAVIARSRAAG